uniref:Uncharacterized protein n=1 Tax=Aegilops tauschii subsp. strangulata TaxID=200361 RepID=A0A453G4H3_AEGTS
RRQSLFWLGSSDSSIFIQCPEALSERSAEKKIKRMLFPRYRKTVKASTEDEC